MNYSNENETILSHYKKSLIGDYVKIGKIYKNTILEYIQKNNLTIEEFANLCKIELKYLEKILDDKIPLEIVLKIEKAINIEPFSLIEIDNPNIFRFD